MNGRWLRDVCKTPEILINNKYLISNNYGLEVPIRELIVKS